MVQFGFKVQKSERLLIREAWEQADAYRPGKPNWFTKKQKDLVALHGALLPTFDLATLPPPTNATSLLGSLLKVLTTGDLALTLCSPEPPVLTELRDWLVATMPMADAVQGLPEEQGRVLAALVRALDARSILDLGTFTGYSSIAMALAAADDAKVTCCEPQRRYANDARNWWLKAGVSAKMEMHECDAVELLRKLLQQVTSPPLPPLRLPPLHDRRHPSPPPPPLPPPPPPPGRGGQRGLCLRRRVGAREVRPALDPHLDPYLTT